ncbi:SLC13 family permease [Flagellimonas meridianipacifica]|uniref:Sodium-dependent dicarboxylate transporter 2/3/5 n=1 Tax=Flagellimonas meridianipacifica TaxID=1080225 RepID=A0A2T0M8M6_9FLAO|nr:SLC13 family permease [Allomuricauda pacifica]PRX53829.1 sodium-dependent dicarboxylate transporter 2/3/5 [Allomuricauda pacifica]
MIFNGKRIGFLLGPLSFFIILFLFNVDGLSNEGKATLATAAWISIWWITEAIPISATALLPFVLFPLTGVMSVKDTAGAFANQMIFLFLGGFIIAVAIEKTNLHKRIALNIINAIGSNWNKVILGFMIATAFLSMWISNTATAVMMLPIGLAVISQINAEEALQKKMGISLMLSIAYGCSIGGIATIIGTPTNVIFVGIAEDLYGESITFAQWMLLGLPFSMVMLLLGWLYLTKVVFKEKVEGIPGGKNAIKAQLKALGKIKYEELMALIVFAVVASLWICSSFLLKKLLPGINDTLIAIVGALALFIIPSKRGRQSGIIDWKTAETIPWGILLLFGGGLALAEGFKTSGLAEWIGNQLTLFEVFPAILLVLAIIIVVNFLTEITSNVATAAMLMPVLAALAITIDVHPYFLMIATTIAASCAFMLPVATPPNAVVFGSGLLTIPKMIKAGLWMNLISIIIATVIVYFLLPLVWGLEISSFPNGFK